MKWTAQDLIMLAFMREQGVSYADCASFFGVTVNSIAGACNRLRAKRMKAKKDSSTEPGLYNPVVALKNNDCRWPIGDPRTDDFKFCCQPRKFGFSYCAEHARIAYVPVQPKKRILNPC